VPGYPTIGLGGRAGEGNRLAQRMIIYLLYLHPP